MPWIDPMKEAQASKELVRSGFASETEIIRARGKRPEDVLEQIKAWRKKTDDAGVVLESNAAHTSKSGISQGESPAAEDAGETGPEDQ
jgi:capsid protein